MASRSKKPTHAISGKGTGPGAIRGIKANDRKDYGMNKSIPSIKIADR